VATDTERCELTDADLQALLTPAQYAYLKLGDFIWNEIP